MAQIEKESLLNNLVVMLAEDYSLNIGELKVKISSVLQDYHVTVSDERFIGNDLSTEYLMKKFYDGKSAVGISKETVRQYEIAIKILEKYTGKSFAECESEDITNFLLKYSKDVSPVTLRGKFLLLSSVYNYLYIRRYIPSNPITDIS